jgi:hypothetical protein
MRKPSGLILETSLDTGKVREIESFMCHHCNRHTILWKGQRPSDIGGFCTICGSLICSSCVGKGCDPLEKKIQRWADQAYFRAQMKEW